MAHGGNPDNICADDLANIEILLSDGFIGNKAMLLALSYFSTGNLNAKLQKGAQPYTMKDILPSIHDYLVPPLDEAEAKAQTNNQLLKFMMMAPDSKLMPKE